MLKLIYITSVHVVESVQIMYVLQGMLLDKGEKMSSSQRASDMILGVDNGGVGSNMS